MDYKNAVLAGLLAAAAGSTLLTWLAQRKAREGHRGVFVLVIKLKTAAGRAQEFIDAWAPLAKYCQAHEPRTLSYEASISDKEPDTILIFERYITKADLTEIHQKSEPFIAFRSHPVQAIVLEKEGLSFYETNVGFMRQ